MSVESCKCENDLMINNTRVNFYSIKRFFFFKSSCDLNVYRGMMMLYDTIKMMFFSWRDGRKISSFNIQFFFRIKNKFFIWKCALKKLLNFDKILVYVSMSYFMSLEDTLNNLISKGTWIPHTFNTEKSDILACVIKKKERKKHSRIFPSFPKYFAQHVSVNLFYVYVSWILITFNDDNDNKLCM